MTIQDIQGESYHVDYEPTTVTVSFHGSLRLGDMAAYAPITELLTAIADQQPPIITLNLKELKFLNSSGINMLSKFVIGVRKQKSTQIVVKGSEDIPWQGKSLKNLQRLMPSLSLELD